MKFKKLLALDWTYNKELNTYSAEIYGNTVRVQWDRYPQRLKEDKPRHYPCIYLNDEFMKIGKDVTELADAIRKKHAARFDKWLDSWIVATK